MIPYRAYFVNIFVVLIYETMRQKGCQLVLQRDFSELTLCVAYEELIDERNLLEKACKTKAYKCFVSNSRCSIRESEILMLEL
jgi:hypothetical protein